MTCKNSGMPVAHQLAKTEAYIINHIPVSRDFTLLISLHPHKATIQQKMKTL
jgi:hypothetical protein